MKFTEGREDRGIESRVQNPCRDLAEITDSFGDIASLSYLYLHKFVFILASFFVSAPHLLCTPGFGISL